MSNQQNKKTNTHGHINPTSSTDPLLILLSGTIMDNPQYSIRSASIAMDVFDRVFLKGSQNIEVDATKEGIIPDLKDCLSDNTKAWDGPLAGMTTYQLMSQFGVNVRPCATSQENAQAFFTWAVGLGVEVKDAHNLTTAIGMFVGPMSRVGGKVVFDPATLK